MMLGQGSGYKNVIGKDPYVHSQSAKGIKQPQIKKSGSEGVLNAFKGIFMARPDLRTQTDVDLDRYMGKWHQIAAKPAWFQKGCSNVTAEYALRPDKTVAVTNTCLKDGKMNVARGIAYKTRVGGRLKVSFDSVPFISSNYNILYTDYETAMVGSDDRKYLWILSRNPTIAKTKYQNLISRAKVQGFDVSDLKRN